MVHPLRCTERVAHSSEDVAPTKNHEPTLGAPSLAAGAVSAAACNLLVEDDDKPPPSMPRRTLRESVIGDVVRDDATPGLGRRDR